jgi:hypothetical protein
MVTPPTGTIRSVVGFLGSGPAPADVRIVVPLSTRIRAGESNPKTLLSCRFWPHTGKSESLCPLAAPMPRTKKGWLHWIL